MRFVSDENAQDLHGMFLRSTNGLRMLIRRFFRNTKAWDLLVL